MSKKKAAKKTSKKNSSSTKKSATTTKKTTKKKETKKTLEPEYGVERRNDLKWNDKKVAVFTALKQLKAVSGATSSVSAKAVANKGTTKDVKISTRDVRHYCYHARASNLIEIAQMEETAGYLFYLTAKGSKIDPKAELKKQNA